MCCRITRPIKPISSWSRPWRKIPNLPKKKAARALSKFLVLHPTNISQKIEIIVEHFRSHVRNHLGGQAKAMVVTSTRLQAVKYMQAFQAYIEQHGYHDVQPLVAFSGTVLRSR